MTVYSLNDRLKLIANSVLRAIGPRAPIRWLDKFICARVAPCFLDPDLIAPEFTMSRLRGRATMVPCNPYVFAHRFPYWCGRLYERSLARYLERELSPGDTVIDVGSNVGHITLLAASLVGPSGRVLAFEPNAALAQVCREAARVQGFAHVDVIACGLSDVAGEFTLYVDPQHVGRGTLRRGGDDRLVSPEVVSTSCQVLVGDDALKDGRLNGRVFVKVDVEGLECRVMRGLRRTCRDYVDHAVVEITPQWHESTDDLRQLFEMMRSASLEAFELKESGRPGGPLPADMIHEQTNVLFMRRKS